MCKNDAQDLSAQSLLVFITPYLISASERNPETQLGRDNNFRRGFCPGGYASKGFVRWHIFFQPLHLQPNIKNQGDL
jgi:hypothetical protein